MSNGDNGVTSLISLSLSPSPSHFPLPPPPPSLSLPLPPSHFLFTCFHRPTYDGQGPFPPFPPLPWLPNGLLAVPHESAQTQPTADTGSGMWFPCQPNEPKQSRSFLYVLLNSEVCTRHMYHINSQEWHLHLYIYIYIYLGGYITPVHTCTLSGSLVH